MCGRKSVWFCCVFVGFLFVFFVFLEREKIEGVLKILGFLTESDSFFAQKNPKKTYLTNRALHVTFLLLNRRARSNAPFEHARKHTHKKKKQRDARLPAL